MADTSKISKKGFISVMGIRPVFADPLRKIRVLEAVRKQLLHDFGTIQVPWGESDDPQSPHFFDQAHLYTRRQFKRAWFTLKEVKERTAFACHHGKKPQRTQ